MNLVPYVHAVVQACVILPEDLAYRILELASLFEKNLQPKGDDCDWESFDSMEALVEKALTESQGFQEALDKAVISTSGMKSYLLT